MPEHIAFVVNNYPPSVGGVERHVAQLAAELVVEGHQVTVVALSKTPGVAVEDGVHVWRLPRWLTIGGLLSFPRLGATRRIARELHSRGVTVLSTHTRFFPMSWAGVRIGGLLAIPVVHTEHGSGFVRGVSPAIGFASRVVDVTLGRGTLRRATVVLAVSSAVRSFVGRLADVEALVFPNAIDPAPFLDARHRGDGHRFVFLGRLVPGKGWDTLLDAVAILRRSGLDFAVDIVGDGPDREAAERRSEDLGLADIVAVHGRVEGAPLAELLAGGVLVNPSTLAEGFQTSMLEALAAGSSVVTFDVPGLVEIGGTDVPLIVVPDRDAISLADAMRRTTEMPLEPIAADRMTAWSWRTRAREYAAIVAHATAQPTKPT
jgi:glycosyltransferase involved in cell wall biosynthesis